MNEVTGHRPSGLPTSVLSFLGGIGPQWGNPTVVVWQGRYSFLDDRLATCVTIPLADDSSGAALATFVDGIYVEGWTWLWCANCPEEFRHAVSDAARIGYDDLVRLVSEVAE